MQKGLIILSMVVVVGIGLLFSGCQQTAEVPDVLKVLSVSPALDATDVDPGEDLSISFNYPINNSGITAANLFSTYLEYVSGSHNAGDPTVTGIEWSADGKTLTVRVENWSGLAQGNTQVAIRARNRIKDIFGNELRVNPVLWRYRLRYSGGSTTTTTTTTTSSTDTTSSTTTTTTTTTLPDFSWTQATGSAAWSDREGFSSVVFNGKMWVIAGFTNVATNDVWASSDGINWDLMTPEAAFNPRHEHTSVVFDGKIWVIGGYSSTILYTNEVWSSSNGIDWQLATPEAAFSGRECHTSLVYDGKMWVIGGYGAGHRNDVYSSIDGVTWNQVTAAAGFAARNSHASVVYDGRMWVIGGVNDNLIYDDVWYSYDGMDWHNAGRIVAFPAPPPTSSSEVARAEHTAVTYCFNGNEYLFVTGGYNNWISGSWVYDYLNDLRYTDNGTDWISAETTSVYSPRGNHASVVFNDKIWVLGGGNDSTNNSEVWYSPKP